MEIINNDTISFFITGGTGPFGMAFMRYLNNLNKNAIVFLLTRDIKSTNVKINEFDKIKINLIEGQLPFVDKEIINDLPKVDYVLHMASVTASESFHHIDPLYKYLLLAEGTLDICKYAVLVRAKRLLFTSSGAVYGSNSNGLPMKENAPLQVLDQSSVNNSLTVGKVSAEYICNYFREHTNLETKIARCFSFCGKDIPTNLHYAIGNFCENAINGNDIIIKGDGKAIRSYMDLDDLSNWIFNLLCFSSPSNIYNFGSDNEISIYELATKIVSIVKSKSKIIVLGKSNHTLSNPKRNYYVPSLEKVYNELNLNMEYNIDQTIIRYINTI